jgi:HEAT repeat protein
MSAKKVTKKYCFLLAACALVCLLVVTSALRIFPHGNYYRGRSSYYWQREVKKYAKRTGWSAPYADRLLNFLGVKGGSLMPAVLEQDPAAVPVLIDLAQDDDWDVRCLVLESLRRLGPSAKSAIPVVRDATRDSNTQVCGLAFCALEWVGSDVEVVKAAVDAQRDSRAEVRLKALEFLHMFWEAGKREGLPMLMSMLRDEDETVRSHAAEALGAVGARADAAVPALLRVINDESPSVRRAAREALRRIDPHSILPMSVPN